MEIGEEVAMLMASTKDELCKKAEEAPLKGFECRIGNKGELDIPTAERLYQSMKTAKALLPSDPPKKGAYWDLDQCTPLAYPLQSHHLIPKMHLPKHDVCVWLAKKLKNSEWELEKSTNYDTDDARNGMSLPFASNTHQYKNANNADEKDKACDKMMFLTKKQLHQGQHTDDSYDDWEEPALHQKEGKGYLGAVDELLQVVHAAALEHYEGCDACKKSKTKPVKIRPLERMVEAIHQASSLMGSIITSHKRFVSKRAAKYYKSSISS